MKKKNRPSVPPGASLTLYYGHATEPIWRSPYDSEFFLAGWAVPIEWDDIDWSEVVGWVVVDEDGTVTIGPQ